jgi:predicted metalloprotease
LVVLLALSWVTGTDFLSMFSGGVPFENAAPSGELRTTAEEEETVDFMNAVVEDLQGTWRRHLSSRYEPTVVSLFREAVESGCGFAQAATGPFYCPADHKVYLDLSFFNDLSRQLGAPGDFAQAYVIAHEFGHHVQNLLGYTQRVQSDPRPGANSASVALELQADCFAGVWGHDASQQGRASAGRVELDPGDAEEGLRAAAAIGDDRLQRMSTGRVVPESFTHGTSAQRTEWFRRGMASGDPRQCDTFQ